MCQSNRCYIVPQYLLRSIVESNDEEVTPEVRQNADWTLREGLVDLRAKRADIFASLTVPRGFHAQQQQAIPHRHSIVPDVLFQQIADSDEVDEDTRGHARAELEHIRSKIAEFKAVQEGSASAQKPTLQAEGARGDEKEGEVAKFYRAIYDAQKNPKESKLPGKAIRLEGQDPTGDVAADSAYDNGGLVLQFYKDKFNWNSIDNKGMHVVSSVHFGINYENAYWDPSKMQMVYGDGDKFLYKFAECIDVIGHEMTHAITEHTSPLNYQGQSGALNEHVSDVFGIMVKQFKEQEKAAEADWLIGEGCLLPGVKGVALRNMKEPGTAYSDPRFGKDPQPNHMSGFKVMTADNGGVHIYSGIPNRAFCLASIAFGGFSWEKAGQIWWHTMNSGRIPPRCNFVQFADVTVEVADEKYGEEAAKIVREAWNTVGVVRKQGL
ncbi:hypothetical protein RB598_007343 [Gaeumannomyces tritici]